MYKAPQMSGSQQLRVICLISGGKDSLYSLLHCVKQGHNVVALANLYSNPSDISPPDVEVCTNGKKHHLHDTPLGDTTESDQTRTEADDLNSFMFQTVGHSIIPLYSKALGIPVYRRRITGGAANSDRDYRFQLDKAGNEDETESLTHLLRAVCHDVPSANAVSAGAILSTYQRTRIESVAVRLGLIPLAWLWMYPYLPPSLSPKSSESVCQPDRPDSLLGLLEDMDYSNSRAVIIKIASAGLADDILGADLTQPKIRNRILFGMKRLIAMGHAAGFHEMDIEMSREMERDLRASVLGEGGEYESLALEGPRTVWKGKIILQNKMSGVAALEQQKQVCTSEGGVSYLKIGKAEVEMYSDEEDENIATKPRESETLVRSPGLYDPQFVNISRRSQTMTTNTRGFDLEKVHNSSIERFTRLVASREQWDIFVADSKFSRPGSVSVLNSFHIGIPNVTCLPLPIQSQITAASSQMTAIIDRLRGLLQSLTVILTLPSPLTTSNIISTTLLLSSIPDFSIVNPIYASMFKPHEPNPPSRVTIACPLPEGIKVCLNVLLDTRPRRERRALHVQSRSYWAPANIGPYSQAVSSEVILDTDQATSGQVLKFETVHLAGQIPLVPATMEPLQGAFADQAVLGLQHLWRVAQERGVDVWPWGVAFVAMSIISTEQGPAMDMRKTVQIAARVWRSACGFHRTNNSYARSKDDKANRDAGEAASDSDSESDTVDLWDLKYNRSFVPDRKGGVKPKDRKADSRSASSSGGNHLQILPNPAIYDRSHLNTTSKNKSPTQIIPPFIAAEVTSLPRGVPVEWWSLGLADLLKYTTTINPSVRVRQEKLNLSFGNATCLFVGSGSSGTNDCYGEDDTDPDPERESVRPSGSILTVCFLSVYVTQDQWQEHDTKSQPSHHRHLVKELQAEIHQLIPFHMNYQPPNPPTPSQPSMSTHLKTNLVHGTAFISQKCDLEHTHKYLTESSISDNTPTETNNLEIRLQDLTVIPCFSVWATEFSSASETTNVNVNVDVNVSEKDNNPLKDKSPERIPSRRTGDDNDNDNDNVVVAEEVAFAMILRVDVTHPKS